jgi:hypothetical protein
MTYKKHIKASTSINRCILEVLQYSPHRAKNDKKYTKNHEKYRFQGDFDNFDA